MLQENDEAPAFAGVDQEGRAHRLEDYAGKWLLLYFYPKDDTPGCTAQACGLRDAFSNFAKEGIAVVGVSADTEASHQAFAKKFALPFPLLADTERSIIGAYDVWKEKILYGKPSMGISRSSFLIAPNGRIAKVYERVVPETHAAQVLEDLTALR